MTSIGLTKLSDSNLCDIFLYLESIKNVIIFKNSTMVTCVFLRIIYCSYLVAGRATGQKLARKFEFLIP